MVIICDMKYEGHIIHGLYLFCECQGAEMHLRQIFRIPLQPASMDGSDDDPRCGTGYRISYRMFRP